MRPNPTLGVAIGNVDTFRRASRFSYRCTGYMRLRPTQKGRLFSSGGHLGILVGKQAPDGVVVLLFQEILDDGGLEVLELADTTGATRSAPPLQHSPS